MGYSEQFNELIKSIDNANRLNYFKAELLKILDAKEKNEDSLSKAIENYFKEINKSIYGISIEKGRAGTIGEIRTWKDGKKYKKMPNGKWVRVYQQQNRSAEISIARLKGKVRNAQSVDELMQIVMNNIHRFEDENGQILPIVEELKKEVASGKTRINAGKPSTKEQIEKIKAEKENEIKKKKASNNKITIKDIPEIFTKGGWKPEITHIVDFLNEHEDADPRIISLFKNLSKIKFDEPFKVKKLPKRASEAGRFVISIYRDSGIPAETSLQLQKGVITDQNKNFHIPIMIHEFGHLFDYAIRPNPQSYLGFSENDEDFLDIIDSCQISEEQKNEIVKEMKDKTSHYIYAIEQANEVVSDMRATYNEYTSGKITYEEYVKEYNDKNQFYEHFNKVADREHSKYFGDEQFVDIIDAITGGEMYGHQIGGHGKKYYQKTSDRAKEIFANYIALLVYKRDNVERLKNMFPELVERLDMLVDTVLYRLGDD